VEQGVFVDKPFYNTKKHNYLFYDRYYGAICSTIKMILLEKIIFSDVYGCVLF